MLYEPVRSERYYERDLKYSDIDWMRFPDAVDAFDLRMRGWYIEPVELLLERGLSDEAKREVRRITKRQEGGHYSFTVMAMTCMLIDTLSQYVRGVPEGTRSIFKDFVKTHLPSYAGTVSPPIDGYRLPPPNFTAPQREALSDVADVLYHGFRCGILHQAHAPLYCGVVPGKQPPKLEATNHAKYAAGAIRSTVGADCPVLVICPEHLYDEVMAFFSGYLRDLKDQAPQFGQLRTNFKAKFAESFGIDLTNSTF